MGIHEALGNNKYSQIFEKIAMRIIRDIIPAYNVLTEVLDNSKGTKQKIRAQLS